MPHSDKVRNDLEEIRRMMADLSSLAERVQERTASAVRTLEGGQDDDTDQ